MRVEEKIKNEYNLLIEKLYLLYLEAINEEREKGASLDPITLYARIYNRINELASSTEVNLFDSSNLMERVYNEVEVEFNNAVNTIKDINEQALKTNNMMLVSEIYEELRNKIYDLSGYELVSLLFDSALANQTVTIKEKK